MQNVVLIAANVSKEFEKFLLQNAFVLCSLENYSAVDSSNLVGVVTSNKININKKFIDSHKNLRWVARLGSGLEIIDLPYCKSKNIFVCSSPQGIAQSVAQHALAMLIALQKNIVTSHQQIQQALWIREPNRGWELENKTIGLIGYGNTAQAFAKLLSVFNVTVLAYDVKWQKQMPIFENTLKSTLKNIYAKADVVSYHVPLLDSTNNYYKAANFSKEHILINTSRGKVCFTKEILEGFKTKKLVGACLDVLDFENQQPFNATNKKLLNNLLKNNSIITPHIAGYSHNAIQKMCAELQIQLKLNI